VPRLSRERPPATLWDHALSKPVKTQYNTNCEVVLVLCNKDITIQNNII
jgi:hypothetical protein